MDYKLELVLVPVSDADRAKRFYVEQAGFDLLVDTPTGLPGQRVVQVTPTRSACSIDVRALFQAPNYAHIATLPPDGGPYTVPVWAGIEDGVIAFLTSPGSRKARNPGRPPAGGDLGHRPQPAVRDGAGTRPGHGQPGRQAWEIIDRISRTYTSQPYPLRTGRVVFLIEPEHARAQAFG